MNADQRVDRRDLEQPDDAGIDGDDREGSDLRPRAGAPRPQACVFRPSRETCSARGRARRPRTPRRRAPLRGEEPSRGRPLPRRARPSHLRAPTRCERQTHPTWPPRTSLDGRAGGSHGASGDPDGRPHRAHDPVGPAFPERGDARSRRHRKPRRAPVRAYGRPSARGPERPRREQLRRRDRRGRHGRRTPRGRARPRPRRKRRRSGSRSCPLAPRRRGLRPAPRRRRVAHARPAARTGEQLDP